MITASGARYQIGRRPTTGVALVLAAIAMMGSPVSAATAAPQAPTTEDIAPIKAPQGAPNVVVVLLDDVGFGAAGTFGGPVATPTLDLLASQGLRYNRFHTTAICSPTRASLLSGRNPHAVGIGSVMNSADERPGYHGVHVSDATGIAEILRRNGYSTAMFGKWHQTPDWELSISGPFDRWPTGMGFEKFYGFHGGETDQFEPTLIEGTTAVMRPAGSGYHLTEDLVDESIKWIRNQHSVTPDKPFFLYFSAGATHAPLQAPKEWIDRYRGKFDQGWDAIRKDILAHQKKAGVVPANTQLTPRPEGLPAWDSLTADQRKIASRLMEVYAGFLGHTDTQLGRLVSALKESGQFDNTMFVYIVGDNGASAEGGMHGSINYMGSVQGLPENEAETLKRLDEIGGPTTYAHFPSGWAWAMNTPFQWTKSVASHLGGTRNPMVISWPKGITDRGGVRSQFGHVNDIMPTILEAAKIKAPESVDGVQQRPINGVSLAYSFNNRAAPERHTTQYFEVYGHRAVYKDGWMASAFHTRFPWQVISTTQKPFEEDRWELYDLRSDFSQAHDLAAKEPEKLKLLQAAFMQEAQANQVLPLKGQVLDANLPSLTGDRTEFTYYPGARVPEKDAPKIFNRSWSLSAAVDVADASAGGVIATMGGAPGGWSLYLDAQRRPVFTYKAFEAGALEVVAPQPLGTGSQVITVDFDYAGGGRGKGAVARLVVNGKPAGEAKIAITPPAYFSINETFDVGIDSGSAAGNYPSDAPLGYPFKGGEIRKVDVRLK